jgi:hypothetical protein
MWDPLPRFRCAWVRTQLALANMYDLHQLALSDMARLDARRLDIKWAL